jgi:Effector-associated domain 7
MKLLQVSLASAAELKPDREQFEIFVNRKNKQWIKQGFFIELIIWEDFLDAFVSDGLQNSYNRAIADCDIFVMLYHTKVGKYTHQEFETAIAAYRERGRPIIYTFCKNAAAQAAESSTPDPSLQAFAHQLDDLGHFPTHYRNTEDLLLRFGAQMDRLRAAGLLDATAAPLHMPAQGPPASSQPPQYQLARVMQLLDAACSAEDLEDLAFTHFEVLRRQFTPGMQQRTRIQLLVTHARNHGRLPELLSALQALNPHQYALCGPYEHV